MMSLLNDLFSSRLATVSSLHGMRIVCAPGLPADRVLVVQGSRVAAVITEVAVAPDDSRETVLRNLAVRSCSECVRRHTTPPSE